MEKKEKDYDGKYKPDYTPKRNFFKSTWVILLAIAITTASLLYVVIFDGSSVPFAISFVSCLVLFITDMIKHIIEAIKEKSLFAFLFCFYFLAHAVYFLVCMFTGGNRF